MNDNTMQILPGQSGNERAVAHVRSSVSVLRREIDPENRAAAIERDRIYGAKTSSAGGLAGAGAQRIADSGAGEAQGAGAGAGAGGNQGAGVKA